MSDITVSLGERSYTIVVEAGGLARARDRLLPFARTGRMFVAYDEAVEFLLEPLRATGIAIEAVAITSGEAAKSWSGLEQLCDVLLTRGIERGETLIALGGGVVGDLAGLAAALVKRGCRSVQIPTTLLAQVDSSVGGKTAINTRHGKNMIGVFNQPELVLVDPELLRTLPERQMRAGYAEIVKYALIDDPQFFDWLEERDAQVLAHEPEALAHAIGTSVAAKARIVTEDEREVSGRRALLNLGHTFGHAFEAATGFGERLLHGEAVAAGIATAFRFSASRGHCPQADATRVVRHFAAVGLPVNAPQAGAALAGAQLAALMAHDKKRAGGRVPFILARGIGQSFVDTTVELSEVAAFLDAEASSSAANSASNGSSAASRRAG